jgi:cytoskeletal protein CcmA (bactofilin family)
MEMLKKTKSENDVTDPAPSPVSSTGKTIIGKLVAIEGGIQGSEDLVIEGTVRGSIELEKFHLTVGPKGKVEAQIRAGNVTVSGQLKGNIKALDRVDITKDADFNGEIKAKRISVEDGAYLKAVIEVERESQKKVEPVGKANDSFASAPGKEPIILVSEGDKGK